MGRISANHSPLGRRRDVSHKAARDTGAGDQKGEEGKQTWIRRLISGEESLDLLNSAEWG